MEARKIYNIILDQIEAQKQPLATMRTPDRMAQWKAHPKLCDVVGGNSSKEWMAGSMTPTTSRSTIVPGKIVVRSRMENWWNRPAMRAVQVP